MSPLARNDDNTLATHAVLFGGTWVIGAGLVVGAAAATVAPHVAEPPGPFPRRSRTDPQQAFRTAATAIQ